MCAIADYRGDCIIEGGRVDPLQPSALRRFVELAKAKKPKASGPFTPPYNNPTKKRRLPQQPPLKKNGGPANNRSPIRGLSSGVDYPPAKTYSSSELSGLSPPL